MKRVISILIIGTILLSIISTISCSAMGDYSGNITGATWYWPIHGYSSTASAYANITSSYGYRGGGYGRNHYGVDIGASVGTNVYPTRKGTVCVVKNTLSDGQGRTIFINHGDGYYSVYMHLSKIYVSQGQTVDINTPIAASGASGYGSETYYDPHLHFGVHYGSSYSYNCNVNPCPNGYTRVGNSMQESAGGYPVGSASISYSVNEMITPLPVPETPTITSVSTESASSIKIKWNSVDGATSYRVRRRKSGDEDYVTAGDVVGTTSFTDTGLEPGTKYFYKIFAVNSAGSSEGSERAEVMTLCDTPVVTTVEAIDTTSINVQWSKVKGASSYVVRRRKSGDEDYVTAGEVVEATTFTDTGLEPGTKYFYIIRAVNSSGWSPVLEKTEAMTLCDVPVVTAVKAVDATSINIQWKKVKGASSYRVRRRTSGEEDYVTAAESVTSTSFTDTDLEPGTKYFYKIFAINDAGSSMGSERAEAVTLCDAPVITSVEAISTSSIAIKWDKVNGATSYLVRRRTSGEEDYVTAAESVTSTSFTDTDLEPGTKYFYKIFAINDAGSSMGSERAEMYPILTLKIDPQGGTRKDTTDVLTSEFQYGETKRFSAPTKDGYKFVGWALDFKGDNHINGYWGTPIHSDPIFENSYDSISVYDKSENDIVIIERTIRDSDCGIKGTYMLKIATTGVSKPGLGGFRQLTDSKAGGVFYHVIYAKIPKGYSINQANNACGDNATFEWITSQAGTGNWEPYVYKVTCGTKGTFSTFGHVYLSGPDATEESPVKWSVGYSEVFDATDVNMSENIYTMGGGNATVYALWQKLNPSINAVVAKNNNTYNITANLLDIDGKYEIIVAGYKGNKFVTMKKVSYNEQNPPYTLEGDIDTIKIMVWNSLSALKPLCNAKVISNDEFITE